MVKPIKIYADDSTTRKVIAPDYTNNKFDLSWERDLVYIRDPFNYYDNINDLKYWYKDEGIINYNAQISTTALPLSNYSIENLTEDICDINSDWYVSWKSNGKAKLVFNYNSYFKKKIEVDIYQTNVINETLVGYADGSLGQHLFDEVNRLLEGKLNSAKVAFSSRNADTGVFIRNPDSYMANVKGITALSVWNNSYLWAGGSAWWYRNVSLISPIHYIGAQHWDLRAGDKVKFVSKDNVVYERTVLGVKDYGGTEFSKDLAVGILDEELPSDIDFFKILPADFNDYLVGYKTEPPSEDIIYFDLKPPIINFTQDYWYNLYDWNGYTNTICLISTPTNPVYLSFYQELRGGDSGLPNGCIINNEWVLLGCNYTIPGKPFPTAFIDWINTKLDELSTEHSKPFYHLSEVDLSGFHKYK